MAKPGITPTSSMRRKPQTRQISMRSASHHIAGTEKDYPTLKFSGRVFVERPRHNPFAGLENGYLLIDDNFERATLGSDYLDPVISGYGLPILTGGIAYQPGGGLYGATGQYLNGKNHFAEVQVVGYLAQLFQYDGATWPWVRGRIGAGISCGYFLYPTLGSVGFDELWLSLYRWDAPEIYPLVKEVILSGVSVPDGSKFRLSAEGRILTVSMDVGSGLTDVFTYEVPADDPYLFNTGVGFGCDEFSKDTGGIGVDIFRAGLV